MGEGGSRVGTSESCILQQEALTHWEDDHSAVPFLLRLRNSQLMLNCTLQAPWLETEMDRPPRKDEVRGEPWQL